MTGGQAPAATLATLACASPVCRRPDHCSHCLSASPPGRRFSAPTRSRPRRRSRPAARSRPSRRSTSRWATRSPRAGCRTPRGHDRPTQPGLRRRRRARAAPAGTPACRSSALSCGGATTGTLLQRRGGLPAARRAQPGRPRRGDARRPTPRRRARDGQHRRQRHRDVRRRRHGRRRPGVPARRRGDAATQTLPADRRAAARGRAAVDAGRGARRLRPVPVAVAERRAAAGRPRSARWRSSARSTTVSGRSTARPASRWPTPTTRFATDDMTHRRRAARPRARCRCAVYNVCTLTWACSPPPIGHDDHARPSGYHQLAEAILDVLHACVAALVHAAFMRRRVHLEP